MMRSSQTTAMEVARYMLRHAQEQGSLLTNLKLQKLLYYAQGWHIALFNKPCFPDEIEAWIHGPVVPQVYREYKSYQWKPIVVRPKAVALPPKQAGFLDELLNVFLPLDASQLERMTHSEPPWKEARGNLEPDESCRRTLSLDTMKRYFKSLAK